MDTITRTELPFPLVTRGKVRDLYDLGRDRMLIVTTDRLSAFDVVMPRPIPFKGMVLNQITAWWLERLDAAIPHHLISARTEEIVRQVPELAAVRDHIEHRSMLVRATRPVQIECVVRGYISGSAWKEYVAAGTLAGEPMPSGLSESERLPEPIFSPATKAENGHDENITFAEVELRLGRRLAAELRNRSLSLYAQGSDIARETGIIIADTKFEFGVAHENGELLLIDEVLTPDSSRFWPAESYAIGRGQPSLDKQPVRDWLESLGDAWDKQPPGPDLPDEVVEATSARYRALFERLVGTGLEAYASGA